MSMPGQAATTAGQTICQASKGREADGLPGAARKKATEVYRTISIGT